MFFNFCKTTKKFVHLCYLNKLKIKGAKYLDKESIYVLKDIYAWRF